MRAREELAERAAREQLTPEALYQLLMRAYNDPVMAAKNKAQLMLAMMPPIERPNGT